MIPLSWYLIFAAALFSIGLFGVLARRNAVAILLGIAVGYLYPAFAVKLKPLGDGFINRIGDYLNFGTFHERFSPGLLGALLGNRGLWLDKWEDVEPIYLAEHGVLRVDLAFERHVVALQFRARRGVAHGQQTVAIRQPFLLDALCHVRRCGGGGEVGYVSSQPNKWEHDQNSHGTHVTSTILGYSLLGTPVNGVAPMAKVIPVKVLNQLRRDSVAALDAARQKAFVRRTAPIAC